MIRFFSTFLLGLSLIVLITACAPNMPKEDPRLPRDIQQQRQQSGEVTPPADTSQDTSELPSDEESEEVVDSLEGE